MVTLIRIAIVSLTSFSLIESFKGFIKHSSVSHLSISAVDLGTVNIGTKTRDSSNFEYTTFPDWRGGGFESIENTPIATFLQGNEAIICDADSFVGRLKVYKTLIDAVPMYRSNNNENNFGSTTLHFLWGFCAQLEWQCRSGRLIYPQIEPISDVVHLVASGGMQYYDTIDTNSWWGRMNFALCIPIYKGAERAGIVLPYSTEDIKGSYMDTMVDYEEIVDLWASVWKEIISEKGTTGGYDDADIDNLRCSIWNAHVKTLETSVILNKEYYEQLPLNEQTFGTGFTRFVDFLAAGRWHTDIAAINKDGAGYLPRSVLFDESIAEKSDGDEKLESKLSAARELATLTSTMDLGVSNKYLYNIQLNFVATACKNYEARQQFSGIIRALLFRHEDPSWYTKVLPLVSWFIKESF